MGGGGGDDGGLSRELTFRATKLIQIAKKNNGFFYDYISNLIPSSELTIFYQ